MDSQLAQSCRSGHAGHSGQVGEAFSTLPELDASLLIKVLHEPRGVCWLPRASRKHTHTHTHLFKAEGGMKAISRSFCKEERLAKPI